MAINEISDVVTTNGLLVPKSAQPKSQLSYIARVALFTALTLSSILPYQASPQTGRQEGTKPSPQTKEQGKNPDLLYLQEDRIIKTKQGTQLSTPKKSSEEKSTDTSTKKQEKKEPTSQTEEQEKKPSSLLQWYNQTRAAGLNTHKDYKALGLGFSHVAPSQGGVSEASPMEGTGLQGVIELEFKKIPLLPNSLSAKAGVLTEPDGSNGSRIRLMPAYLFSPANKNFTLVLEPIFQYTGRNVSTEKHETAEYEQNLRDVGARISVDFDKRIVIYFQDLEGDGRYRLPHKVSGGRHSQDTEAGLQLKLRDNAIIGAYLKRRETNYTDLPGENSDSGYSTGLILAQEFKDRWLGGIRVDYENVKSRADDRRIPNSVKVEELKGGLVVGYRFAENWSITADVTKGHDMEGSFGFVWTPNSSSKRQMSPEYYKGFKPDSSSKKQTPPDNRSKKQTW